MRVAVLLFTHLKGGMVPEEPPGPAIYLMGESEVVGVPIQLPLLCSMLAKDPLLSCLTQITKVVCKFEGLGMAERIAAKS